MGREQTRGSSFLLRDYRSADFDAVVALDADCFEPGIAYPAGEMRGFLALATREAVVAESGGALAGFCLGYRAPSDVGRVITLDVRAGMRRGGIGTALLEEIMERLALAGAREIVLEVDVRNPGAIAFYEGLGFRPTGTIPDYYGRGHTALEMSRPSVGADADS